MKNIPENVIKEICVDQTNEIDGSIVYSRLAKLSKTRENREILETLSRDEGSHYEMLKEYSGRDVKPHRFKNFLFVLCARILGLTFTLKLMENGEKSAKFHYRYVDEYAPELKTILEDEERHERELLEMIGEKRLTYMGSIVLGLNDALVELTGALAGYTLALGNSRNIALLGLITGISASFSMAASEFLSKKQEEESNALSSSIYTGLAYIFTVILLVLPFFLIDKPFICLIITVSIAVFIIFLFNFYISVAKDLKFRSRFLQMAAISIGVSALSFGIGWVVKNFLGFDL